MSTFLKLSSHLFLINTKVSPYHIAYKYMIYRLYHMGRDYLQTLLHSWTQPFLWLLDNKQPENRFIWFIQTL